jgi:hypothetical protein
MATAAPIPTPSPSERVSSLTLDHSSLSGVGDAGLAIWLVRKNAVFSARRVLIDYSLGVRVMVGAPLASGLCEQCRAPEQGGGRIDVSDSAIRSSQGVAFSTTDGVANFVDDRLQDGSRGGPLLVSRICRAVDTPGIGPNCESPAVQQKRVFTTLAPN